MNTASRLNVVVHAVRMEARHIVSLELRPCDGTPLPAFAPGAHVDLHLSDSLVRSYSLLDAGGNGSRYAIAVLNDKNSKGGSRYVHEQLRVGQTLSISWPRNHFPLNEGASNSVLVAGGIGITPILCMHKRLRALQRPAALLYCARSRGDAAFRDELEWDADVRFHFDDERGGPPDLEAFLAAQPAESDFYCCGPAPMIAAFEASCSSLGLKNVHVERFAAKGAVEVAQTGSYEVVLARDGRILSVPPGSSLLDVLLEAEVEVDSACREGICGACETRVLDGVPDHRDSILSDAERASGKAMLVCVSGCAGSRLVLDL
jgi:tetrachlorobenzoquinone reductase